MHCQIVQLFRWWRTSLRGDCQRPTTRSLGQEVVFQELPLNFSWWPRGFRDYLEIWPTAQWQIRGGRRGGGCPSFQASKGDVLGPGLCEVVPEDADGSPYIQSKDLETEQYPDFPSLGEGGHPHAHLFGFERNKSRMQHPASSH